jgi:hypothetical protein
MAAAVAVTLASVPTQAQELGTPEYEALRAKGVEMLKERMPEYVAQRNALTAFARADVDEVNEYQLQGCARAGEIMDNKPMNAEACKKTIKETNDNFINCTLGLLMVRSVYQHESPDRRPPGVALDAQVACMMMIKGVNEKTAKGVLDQTCNESTSYESQAYCRKERGR